MREVIISLVQSINGAYAQDGWSTGVSTPTDFTYFVGLRRRAGAILIDRRTALNPQLPMINAPGKVLEHTPVYVLTESDAEVLSQQLAERGLDYRAVHFTPDSLPEVIAGLETTGDMLLCESGPNLAYRLLDHGPGVELHLSISPRYLKDPGTHFSALDADIPLRVRGVEQRDDQVIIRYVRA
ncbi:hypothetical protein GCM10009700_12260 [Brevibacterium sanguinis]|uniref:dihydrofolate reductase family protein n=1 Tax=Brevibacterium sanguinis TaxID=232444 RepID=UPI0031D60C06